MLSREDASLMFPSAYRRGYQDGWERAMRASGSAVRHHPDDPKRLGR